MLTTILVSAFVSALVAYYIARPEKPAGGKAPPQPAQTKGGGGPGEENGDGGGAGTGSGGGSGGNP